MAGKSTAPSLGADPVTFRAALLIDTDAGPRRLASVMDPFQRSDFEATDGGWRRAAGVVTHPSSSASRPVFSRVYLERPRGHSKTSDLGLMAAWILFAAPRCITGVAAAADKDQAKLLIDAIRRLAQLNPWLAAVLESQAYRIVNKVTGSTLDVLSADVASSWGITPQFVIVDELTHWPAAAQGLWHSLLSSAAKRDSCMLLIIANAGLGMGTAWQWDVREAARTDPRWYFSHLAGPVASWITPDRLDEQRRMLPAKAFSRLWLNIWQAESGDAISPEDIEACSTMTGPELWPLPWWNYLGAVDLGLKRDHSALVVLGFNPFENRIRLVSCQSWAPPRPGAQVDVSLIERACLDAHRRFGLLGVAFDPYQAMYLGQRLTEQGLPAYMYPFTARNLDTMARVMLDVFASRRLEIYRDPGLIRDLCRLQIIERQIGWRLQATRDEQGHCDLGTALAIGLPWCVDTMRDMLQSAA